MPDQIPEFEHKLLEADMQRLAQEVQSQKESLESKEVGDQEVIKMSLQALAQSAAAATPAPNPVPTVAADVPAGTKLEIEYLLDVAYTQGLDKANDLAKKTSPFVLDAFHDALVSKLYPQLKEQGLVK